MDAGPAPRQRSRAHAGRLPARALRRRGRSPRADGRGLPADLGRARPRTAPGSSTQMAHLHAGAGRRDVAETLLERGAGALPRLPLRARAAGPACAPTRGASTRRWQLLRQRSRGGAPSREPLRPGAWPSSRAGRAAEAREAFAELREPRPARRWRARTTRTASSSSTTRITRIGADGGPASCRARAGAAPRRVHAGAYAWALHAEWSWPEARAAIEAALEVGLQDAALLYQRASSWGRRASPVPPSAASRNRCASTRSRRMPSRRGRCSATSRVEAHAAPALALAPVEQPVVEAVLEAVPELDGGRPQAEAAPVGRPRDGAARRSAPPFLRSAPAARGGSRARRSGAKPRPRAGGRGGREAK